MATLSKELVTQRAGVTGVAYSSSHKDDANAEVAWQATTTLPYTVVLDKAVASDQKTREEIEERLAADPTWEPEVGGGE